MRDGRGVTEPFSAAAPRFVPPPGLPPPAGAGVGPSTEAAPAVPNAGRRPSRWLIAGAVTAVVALVAAILTVNLRVSHRPAVSTKQINGIVDNKVNTAVSALQAQPDPAAQVYTAARAGLVVIQSQTQGGAVGAESLGSGIIVNTDGDIMTSLHVVDNSAGIKVTFADGTDSPATVKSSDASHDIAVLTPAQPPTVIVPEVLGGGAQIGEQAFAIGNPLGLVGSVSSGVVSGLNRQFPLANGRTLSGMIQFDAAVNPGSSGGPLLNKKGQVIGIVTGLANPVGDKDFVGIGFAVPIATAGGAAGAPAK